MQKPTEFLYTRKQQQSSSQVPNIEKQQNVRSVLTVLYGLSSDNFFVVYNNDHDIHRKRPQSSDLG